MHNFKLNTNTLNDFGISKEDARKLLAVLEKSHLKSVNVESKYVYCYIKSFDFNEAFDYITEKLEGSKKINREKRFYEARLKNFNIMNSIRQRIIHNDK